MEEIKAEIGQYHDYVAMNGHEIVLNPTPEESDRILRESAVEIIPQENTDETLAKAVDLAPAPEPPKPPTRKEWGKIMRLFFTIQRGRAKQCGHRLGVVEYSPDGNHKVRINTEPRDNCEFCWFAFFNENADMVATADRCFSEEGESTLVRIRGKKFTKNFKKFLSTMFRFKAELDAQAELARKANEQITLQREVCDNSRDESYERVSEIHRSESPLP